MSDTRQLFVKNPDLGLVEKSLRDYVSKHKNDYIPCTPTPYGVPEILSAFVKTKREFWLLSTGEWTSIWEIVDGCEFADPAVAKALSREFKTEAIWIKIAEDYNLWSYQVYRSGDLVDEAFLPSTYFDGDPESDERFSYGDCEDFADAFNSSRELPFFLMTPPQLERNSRLAKERKRVICKFPRKST